ncbi:MAG: hypothetical protein ACR2OW_17795, partial [Methyloligellaceae bacterium]
MLRNFEWPVRLMSGEPCLSAIFACGFSLLVLVLSAGGIFYFGFDVAESGNEQTVQSGSARDIVVHL